MRSLLIAALMASATALPVSAAGDDDSDHVSELEGLRVVHAWTRATSGDHAEVFMDIENESDAEIVLTAVSTALVDDVEIFLTLPGQDSAVEVDELPIPAKSEMLLSPGGAFLELHGLSTKLAEGDEFEMDLTFGALGELEIHVEVEAADADSHGHAGHNH